MKKIEIDALVRAHRGRAHPVASLHLLRQIAIEPDDQEFLCAHARELTIPDLLIWRKRCESGFTGAVIREFARIATEEPNVFKYELLEAPRFSLADEEWIELADLTRGKVPAAIFDRIEARGAGAQQMPPQFDQAPTEDFASMLESALDDFDPSPAQALAQGSVDASMAPDVMLERARNAWSAEERVVLLEWLTAQGLARKRLIEIAATALRAGEHDPRLREWLAGQLASRAAWEAHGLDIVLALLDRDSFAELSSLYVAVWGGIVGAKQSEDSRKGLLDGMIMALALGFIQRIREALTVSQPERAMVFLSALACLDLPTRLSRTIHDLLRAPGVDGEVKTLIEMNVRLVKHKKGRNASFEDIVAAIHCLADASPAG